MKDYKEKYKTGMIFRSKKDPWTDLVIDFVSYIRGSETAYTFNMNSIIDWVRINEEAFNKHISVSKGIDYDKNNKYTMRKEPDRYRYYIDNELHCNSITKSNRRYNWIKFEINISHNDRKLAEKIAQDYLAELRSYGDGKIYDENIKLMNEKFVRPFKEKERLEKEKQLREKELAELQRLKEKYE